MFTHLGLPMNRYNFVLPSENQNAFARSPSAQTPTLTCFFLSYYTGSIKFWSLLQGVRIWNFEEKTKQNKNILSAVTVYVVIQSLKDILYYQFFCCKDLHETSKYLGPSINGLFTGGNTKLCCRGFVLGIFQSTTANKIDSEHTQDFKRWLPVCETEILQVTVKRIEVFSFS